MAKTYTLENIDETYVNLIITTIQGNQEKIEKNKLTFIEAISFLNKHKSEWIKIKDNLTLKINQMTDLNSEIDKILIDINSFIVNLS